MIFDDFFWLFLCSSSFPLEAPLRFPFFHRFIIFIQLVIELVKEGKEDSVKVVQYYVHVEAIKINNPLVDVLLAKALAAVFEKELG